MKVSVVMATCEGAPYLPDQLASVAAQTRPPDELVVCDDASGDATIAIVERFARTAAFDVRIVRNERRLGLTRNFERSLLLAGGDVIFVSDQDDVWFPEKIRSVLECFGARPGTGLVINDAEYSDGALRRTGESVLQRVHAVGADSRSHVAGACTAITAAFRDFLLPFPEDPMPQYDVYIHRWANVIGNKCLLPRTLQAWRIHGTNASRRNEMSRVRIGGPVQRYREFREAGGVASYRQVARELRSMLETLEERRHMMTWHGNHRGVPQTRREILSIIEAYDARAEVASAPTLRKLGLMLSMLVHGHYGRFKGGYSFAKDLLR